MALLIAKRTSDTRSVARIQSKSIHYAMKESTAYHRLGEFCSEGTNTSVCRPLTAPLAKLMVKQVHSSTRRQAANFWSTNCFHNSCKRSPPFGPWQWPCPRPMFTTKSLARPRAKRHPKTACLARHMPLKKWGNH